MALLPTNVTVGQSGHVAQTNQANQKLNVHPNPKADYGAVGNGSTDDSTAFNNCSTAAAATGVMVIPPGTYAMAAAWDLPSNITILAYGATLKATSTGTSTRVITATDKTNIKIYGLTIDGDKASFAGVTEQRHGLYFLGCSNVTLVDVTSNTNKGDGLYLGTGTGTTPCSSIHTQRCTFNANHRNAMSVINCTTATFVDTNFTNTAGTAPEDGIDFEPNASTDTITDFVFRGCRMTGNNGDGTAHNRLNTGITPTLTRIRYDGCTIKSNGLRGAILAWGSGRVDFDGCTIESNGRHGISVEPRAAMADINVRGGSVRTNAFVGIRLEPEPTIALTRVLIQGVELIDNSTAGATTYDAIWVMARTTYVTVANCLMANVAASNQGVPVYTPDTTVQKLTLIGNRYATVSGPSLADEVASRVNSGNA